MIAESLIEPTLSYNGKKVKSGRWYCPFTDKIFTNPSDLDIDHLVPLKEVHRSGGCYWSKAKKKRYANTLKYAEELIAVDDATNQKKGDRDPANWLPPNKDYHCEYVANWLVVKDRWNLSVNANEKEAIKDIIKEKCSLSMDFDYDVEELYFPYK